MKVNLIRVSDDEQTRYDVKLYLEPSDGADRLLIYTQCLKRADGAAIMADGGEIVDRAAGTTEIQAVFNFKNDGPIKIAKIQYQSFYKNENALIFFNVGELDVDNSSDTEIELDSSGFLLGSGPINFVAAQPLA